MRRMPMSAANVRAMIDGRKTRTRRVIVPQGAPDAEFHHHWMFEGRDLYVEQVDADGRRDDAVCPYRVEYVQLAEPIERTPSGFSRYVADGRATRDPLPWRWKVRRLASRFMPREALRYVVHVRPLRAERLRRLEGDVQEIRAEGVEVPEIGTEVPERPDFLEAEQADYATACFREGWDRLNAPRGFGWDSDPAVWVIELGAPLELSRFDMDAEQPLEASP